MLIYALNFGWERFCVCFNVMFRFLWFCSKCWGNNNKLWFSGILHKAIIKVWSTFSKVVGVGKAHKYFPFMQFNDSQTACCLAAWTNRRKPLREQQKKIHFIFHSQRNALTMFLAFLFIMAVACFNKLSLNTQTAWLFAPDKLLYRKILCALPKPAIFEKIE